MLAIREIQRAKGRFAVLVLAVGLLGFLILFQSAIQASLLTSFVGGVRHQSAPVLVFNVDGRRVIQSSAISAAQEEAVRAVEGVERTASLWATTTPAAAGGTTLAVSVVGYADADLGGPERLAEGRWPTGPAEVVADSGAGEPGFELGDAVAMGSTTFTIVGLADGIGVNVLPTLFAPAEAYLAVLQARNPAATLPPPNVLGVLPADGVDAASLAGDVNDAALDLDALTREQAADGNPGVTQIRQSFTVILALFALVLPLVTGLFFLILTLQKRSSLTLLRALGAPARRLVVPLVGQVAFVLVLGLGIAVGGFALLATRPLEDLTLRFDLRAAVTWCSLLAALGTASALASVRRVLQLDPIAATGAQEQR